ncbi:MAG: glycosyltransferase family 39 protein [Rhodanobacteraceae bacterium]|nr:glycosyltransferase family 39 protein [Rhodanobacteraceae bacterium]
MDPAGTHVYEPAATRAPIYPYFLSLIYRFTGLSGSVSAGQLQETFHWVRLIQCALDTLTCLLVFCLTRLLARGSTPAALTASLLYALSPYHLYFSNAILTETLATFITVLAALTTTKAIIGNHTYAWALSGALWEYSHFVARNTFRSELFWLLSWVHGTGVSEYRQGGW